MRVWATWFLLFSACKYTISHQTAVVSVRSQYSVCFGGFGYVIRDLGQFPGQGHDFSELSGFRGLFPDECLVFVMSSGIWGGFPDRVTILAKSSGFRGLFPDECLVLAMSSGIWGGFPEGMCIRVSCCRIIAMESLFCVVEGMACFINLLKNALHFNKSYPKNRCYRLLWWLFFNLSVFFFGTRISILNFAR